MLLRSHTPAPDRPLPRWWWATNSTLFVVMLCVGLIQLQSGEDFVSAMFPLYGIITLIAIPLIAREWTRYRSSQAKG